LPIALFPVDALPFGWILVEEDPPVNLAVAMLIIFGSAKLLNELFERLRQPGIVGEILAGILVGPSMLHWVAPNEFTSTLASLGVMFLLFRVGMEVNAAELIKLGGTAVAVGVLGVVVPFFSGWAFYHLWGHGSTESIFLGTALTATSVGITAQVLAAKGLLDRTASKIILGAAVVDDILALLLLGVVTSVAEGSINIVELVATSGMAIAFILLVAQWGKRTMAHVIERLEGRLRMGEGEFALAMVLLFALAALSVKIGVAAIIGAFLAGLALADVAPKRVHDLTLGVTELLVPFFLVDIGLHFQLNVFRDHSVLILALILVPVAVLSKLAGCGLGAIRFGRPIALRVGLGMIPRGEFCMVVAQTGLLMNAITPATFAVIVFMAIAAAMLAPPFLKLAFRNVAGGPEDLPMSPS
jgi:Na+:H+ antiporter